MTNFLDACNIELSNLSLNNVYAVYVKCKKGCTLKFVTTQIVCGGCLGTPNTLQRSSAFIQSVLTLKNLSLVFLKYKKFCVWKKLRKRIKKWRSTNLKNGALCKTLKESPYSASPSRAELIANKTHEILVIRQWQKGIWPISQKQRSNEIKVFPVEAEFFFVKKYWA